MPPSPPDADRPVPQSRYKPEAPGLARVVSSTRLTPDHAPEVRHVVLDLGGLDYPFLEGQSLGVLTPGVDDRGHASRLRLYSIASGRQGEDGSGRLAAICVKRVVRRDPQTGAILPGAASNFLCDARPGDEILVTGPVGTSFLLPDDPRSNLILAATGTGVSPFRGFLRRVFVEHPGWTGQVRLFFGARSAAECLYADEFASYRDRPNFRVSYALSGEQQTADGQRMHVHHRMEERIEELWDLLDREETLLFICGKKGMEDQIEAVLRRRADRDGISWPAFRRVLLDSGRLLIETY
ncbi:ferredoxin reductase domain-containing protein [Tautonia sociabilis]|uniref:Ferredoxin--NADP reductase n=1 Tax=Tautonia sociabilis TaxID=2080755 RepID=A0A432MKT8_9BACT|nr:ferredoxin--NADP(+) reductase [Tautonia sociabilis]RUL87755.1 ferredoxin--NADP(+) reductase [Tautonia sociabilis]